MKTTKSLLFAAAYIITLVGITSLFSCKKEDKAKPDPCKGIVCYNGGYCVNGSCSCPQGYTGPSCETQVTPARIKISSIKVTRFPLNDNGSNWDLFDGPDIYIELSRNGTIITKSNYASNAIFNTPYNFIWTTPIDISDMYSQYTIRLYDDDGIDTPDYMGGILFYIYSSKNKFPTQITLDAGGTVAFVFTVSYLW